MHVNPAKLDHRLRRLESITGRAHDVTWAEAHAAEQRISEFTRAHLSAVLDHRQPPIRDDLLAERDTATLRQWHRQMGLNYDAQGNRALEMLLAKLNNMEASSDDS